MIIFDFNNMIIDKNYHEISKKKKNVKSIIKKYI